ncbi:MAG: bacillithiol system redox-active protein YtxJ [Balneolaceae bacterium]
MGFLDKVNNLFSGSGSDSGSKRESLWTPILSNEDIDAVLLASNERVQVVFKHSGSCSISFFAKLNIDKAHLWEGKEADLYIIDVINSRPVSLEFAERVRVRHESPQLFIIKDGEVVWSDSHANVNSANIKRVFAEMAAS